MTQKFTIFTDRTAKLVLSTGHIFTGQLIGADKAITTAQLSINTTMVDYQSIFTDTELQENIVVFTYPHIGSTGITHEHDMAGALGAKGFIAVDVVERSSNWNVAQELETYLENIGVAAITRIDTRQITRLIRDHQNNGPLRGAYGTASVEQLTQSLETAAITAPPTSAASTSTSSAPQYGQDKNTGVN